MTEPLIISNQCKIISCDERELKLLREIAEAVRNGDDRERLDYLTDALEPWSKHYAEGQL